MRYSIIAQAALILVSVVLIAGFIRPTLGEINKTQDQIFQYKDAIAKASQLNAQLQQLVGIKNSFTQDQIAKLDTMLPDSIDTLSVMNDVQGIFTSLNLALTSISAHDVVAPVANVTYNGGTQQKKDLPSEAYQDITVKFSGSYEDLKRVLQLAEANTDLLEVVGLNFTTAEVNAVDRNGQSTAQRNPNIHDYAVTFRTYALNASQKITTP